MTRQKLTKAEVLAERERLIAAAALVPRREQPTCSNCGATSVRVDALACCWNPSGPVRYQVEKGDA